MGPRTDPPGSATRTPLDGGHWGKLRRMPVYAWVGRDGPRARELRRVHREAHLDGLRKLAAAGRVRHAGPLLDAAGDPVGSLVVFEAESLDDARNVFALVRSELE